MKQYQHFIKGEYVDPIGGQWIDTLDPYTGEAWARIPEVARRMWIAPCRLPHMRCEKGHGPP